MEAARRSLAFCSGRSRLAADNTNRVRRATCDNPQTRNEKNKEDAAREARSKKISMTEKGGGNGGRKERRWWRTTTKAMMYAGGVLYVGVKNNNHHRV